MKKILVLALAAGLAGAAAPLRAGDAPKKEAAEKTLKGVIVDVSCYIKAGAHSASHKKCGTACANAGMPIGLLAGKTLYILAGEEEGASINPKYAEYVDDEVEVKGKTFDRSGAHLIVITEIKRVEKK